MWEKEFDHIPYSYPHLGGKGGVVMWEKEFDHIPYSYPHLGGKGGRRYCEDTICLMPLPPRY